jgi:hypothetical protein
MDKLVKRQLKLLAAQDANANLASASGPIDCACVIHGDAYSWKYVENLYSMLSRHLRPGIRLHVYTERDRPVPEPFIKHCLDDWNISGPKKSWWYKLELFNSAHHQGPLLYFDLDVLICKDITEVVNNFQSLNKFLMVKEPYQDIVNSSIMYWSGDYSYLYNNYVNNKDLLCEEYKKVPRYGDQSYISENVEYDLIENYAPINFINWKHHKIETPINDPSILIFTSRHQKPSNNLELDIVRTNWR